MIELTVILIYLLAGRSPSYKIQLSNKDGMPVVATVDFLRLCETISRSASEYGNPDNAGITEFKIVSQSSSRVNATQSIMIFSLSWIGTMDSRYVIDVMALPASSWTIGVHAPTSHLVQPVDSEFPWAKHRRLNHTGKSLQYTYQTPQSVYTCTGWHRVCDTFQVNHLVILVPCCLTFQCL
jgi:hypothetical protein